MSKFSSDPATAGNFSQAHFPESGGPLKPDFGLSGKRQEFERATRQFSESHPAIIFRLQQQVGMLDKLGWWKQISPSDSHYVSALKNCQSAAVPKFSFPLFPNTQSSSVSAAYAISSVVSAQVETTLKQVDCGLPEYSRLRHTVSEYLRHGVVPSSVPDPSSGAVVHPSPITVLNVAYQLYLDEFGSLIGSIEQEDPNSVRDRNKWVQRLEMWALKALDDYELLERQRESRGKK